MERRRQKGREEKRNRNKNEPSKQINPGHWGGREICGRNQKWQMRVVPLVKISGGKRRSK
jgi:hypothetical protein